MLQLWYQETAQSPVKMFFFTVKPLSGPHIKRTPSIKTGHQLESQNAIPTFTVK